MAGTLPGDAGWVLRFEAEDGSGSPVVDNEGIEVRNGRARHGVGWTRVTNKSHVALETLPRDCDGDLFWNFELRENQAGLYLFEG